MILKKLLYQESDINLAETRQRLSPLHLAAGVGTLAAIEWLLRKGADLTARDDSDHTVLHVAAESSNQDQRRF